ncbi:MAG: fibronectin type III domain-containing protein [Chloroflexota bacterium]
MRIRLLAPAVALLGLLLAVGPVSAAGPATGHWGAVGSTIYPPLILTGSNVVLGSKFGPDGRLYVFGRFHDAAGDETADNLVVFDPATGAWVGLGSNGAGDGALNNQVNDVVWFNGTLIVCGRFTNAGGLVGASYVAAWNGASWARKGGSAFTDGVYTLAVAGGLLYAGGDFVNAAGDATADHVAVFDGYAWHGIDAPSAVNGTITDTVYDLAALDDGRVYIVGNFYNIGPSGKCDRVCWWDPASESWNPVGGSAALDEVFTSSIFGLLLSGSRIYVAGDFENAAGNSRADFVAMWNGSAWTNLGSNAGGTDGALTQTAYGFAAYAGVIIAFGDFDIPSVSGAHRVAAWNGAKWLALGAPNPDHVAVGGVISGRTLYMRAGSSAASTAAPRWSATRRASPPSACRASPPPRARRRGRAARAGCRSPGHPATTSGSGPVRDFVVQYRKYGVDVEGVRRRGPHRALAVVTGLASGARYQFRVAAKTDWGVGAYSAIVLKRAN